MEYPTILGSPIAGTVHALGANVSKVSVGDRVTCGTLVLGRKKPMYGGLQRFCVVHETEIIDIGPDVPFTTAVTLASYTPPSALFSPNRLGLARPSIPAKELQGSEKGKKIVIWGGSSAMGALAVSYAKLAGYTVISTCGAHNIDFVKGLGADHVFDHSSEDTVEKIRGLFPVDYWFDTIALPSTITTILKVLEGQKAHILTLLPVTLPGYPKLPEGVTAQMHLFSTFAEENREWRDWALAKGGFMEKAIQSGALKGVPAEVVGGLESVAEGVEKVHKGVSAKKIVVEPWAKL
jgi:NADPH:quinone reductase-like Zn-dependent oxidoreductase